MRKIFINYWNSNTLRYRVYRLNNISYGLHEWWSSNGECYVKDYHLK